MGALVLLPANNTVKTCRIFPRSFYLFDFTRKVGCGRREWQSSGAGLPPQECGLSQISVPPLSPPLCHSKWLIVGDTKRGRLQSVCCREQAFFFRGDLEPTEGLNQSPLKHNMNMNNKTMRILCADQRQHIQQQQ